MNFANFAGFHALSFVDLAVPKKIVIFVRESFTKRSILHEERAHDKTKRSHSHLQFPRSTLGTPGFLHRCFPVFPNTNLRMPGSFGMW